MSLKLYSKKENNGVACRLIWEAPAFPVIQTVNSRLCRTVSIVNTPFCCYSMKAATKNMYTDQ